MKLTRNKLRKMILLEMVKSTAADIPLAKYQSEFARKKAEIDPETRKALRDLDDDNMQGYNIAQSLGSQESSPEYVKKTRLKAALRNIPGANKLAKNVPLKDTVYPGLIKMLSADHLGIDLFVLDNRHMGDPYKPITRYAPDKILKRINSTGQYTYEDIPHLEVWNIRVPSPSASYYYPTLRKYLALLAFGFPAMDDDEMKVEHAILRAILDLRINYKAHSWHR